LIHPKKKRRKISQILLQQSVNKADLDKQQLQERCCCIIELARVGEKFNFALLLEFSADKQSDLIVQVIEQLLARTEFSSDEQLFDHKELQSFQRNLDN
jgi:hypothetical protein